MNLKDKSLFIQKCFINGKWINSSSEKTFDVQNPSDLSIIGLTL
jgi:succinate-semialdehyde dehydrogenase/glutarate-semialdehyde dehydrogenase